MPAEAPSFPLHRVLLAVPRPAGGAAHVSLGARGTAGGAARVDDELRLSGEAPPARVAGARPFLGAPGAHPRSALDFKHLLPRRVPAACAAPLVAPLDARGAHSRHVAVLRRERRPAVPAELPERLGVVRHVPSPRHGYLPRPRVRAPRRGSFHRCLDGRRTPAAPAEGIAGSARGKGGMRRALSGRWFPGLFSTLDSVLREGKNPGKHRGPCRGSGSCGRLPSRGSIPWKRRNARPEAGTGFPRARPWARGPGRREPRSREVRRRQGPAVLGRRAGTR